MQGGMGGWRHIDEKFSKFDEADRPLEIQGPTARISMISSRQVNCPGGLVDLRRRRKSETGHTGRARSTPTRAENELNFGRPNLQISFSKLVRGVKITSRKKERNPEPARR